MSATTTSAARTVQVLATFSAPKGEREVVAVEVVAVPEGDGLLVLDRPAGVGIDQAHKIEGDCRSLDEAHAVADDYARLAERIGRSAMPEAWW